MHVIFEINVNVHNKYLYLKGQIFIIWESKIRNQNKTIIFDDIPDDVNISVVKFAYLEI